MDTTTKMFYVASKDKCYAALLYVISNVQLGIINKKVVDMAILAMNAFPEIEEANQWLRMVGGTNVHHCTESYIEYVQQEMMDEFLDFEGETKGNEDFDILKKERDSDKSEDKYGEIGPMKVVHFGPIVKEETENETII